TSAVSPPTSTPPIVTPAAMTCGSVVVPVVPVPVDVPTPAETPPAAARPSTNSTARATRFTAKSLASEDPRIVDDQPVHAELAQPCQALRGGHGPGGAGRVRGVAARAPGRAHDLVVQHGDVRLRPPEHPSDPRRQRRPQRRQARPHERGEDGSRAEPVP